MIKKLFLLQQELKKRIYYSPLREKLYRWRARTRLKNKDFTIICNNCWAWSVYEDLGLAYSTPTVGLFFFAPCYIKFLKNIDHYLKAEMTFKNDSWYTSANERRARSTKKYPIGLLEDVEIHFLHYKNEVDAFEKWNRRVKRINHKNMLIAFSDSDLCTVELLEEYDKLPYKNKIVFAAKNYHGIESLVWLKSYAGKDRIGDISTHRWAYRKYFDVVKWLNNAI